MATEIRAVKRNASGKGGARKTRRSGFVPGIMYGAKEGPVPLALQSKELSTLLSKGGETGLLNVILEDDKGKRLSQEKAVIRQVDYHPVKDVPIHIDFMAVAMDRKLTISVPVELTGLAVGVTRNKGLMSQIMYEVQVECLPGNIPSAIKVDVTPLDLGQSIHVGDLPPLEGVRILTGKEQTIVTVEAPKAEEVVEVKPEEEAPAEPEVIGKRKEEEGEEEKD